MPKGGKPPSWLYVSPKCPSISTGNFVGYIVSITSACPTPSTSTASRSDQILNPPQPPHQVKFWIFQGAIKHVIMYPSRLQSRANFYSLEETSYHLFPTLGLKLPRLSPNSKDLNLHRHICTFVSTLGLRLFVVQNITTTSTSVPWWYSYPFPFLLTSFLGLANSFSKLLGCSSKPFSWCIVHLGPSQTYHWFRPKTQSPHHLNSTNCLLF